MNNFIKKIEKTYWAIITAVIFLPSNAFADNCGPNGSTLVLCNPIKQNSITDLLNSFLTVLVQIGTVVAVIMFIYTGFLYVTAQGNEEKVKKAHQIFLDTVIGTAILLGATALALILKGTINAVSGGAGIL